MAVFTAFHHSATFCSSCAIWHVLPRLDPPGANDLFAFANDISLHFFVDAILTPAENFIVAALIKQLTIDYGFLTLYSHIVEVVSVMFIVEKSVRDGNPVP